MRSTKELLSAITRIQNELDKSDEIYKDGQALFSDYDAIRAAGLIYRNTHETQMFHDRFRKLDAIYRRVEELLEAPETNILLIHFYVHGLQAFKRMCMEKETNTAETEIAVSRQFERLDNIEREYENTLWGMADRILFYCAEKKTHVAVWIAHIVRKSARTEDLFRRLDTVARKKIETDAGHSIGDRLNGMSFYKDDLAVVRDTVARCFPETIQVHDFLARSYHRHIAAQFRRIATENATAPEILSLLSWAGEYYSTMQTDHSMKRGSLDPDLLGQREEALVRKYIALCSGKIAAWLLGLAKTERKYFTERAALPEKNENNVYFSPSGIDLFQIVKQHIEAAKKTRNDRLSREIMLQCVVSIGVFQKEICAGIDEETRKYVSAIKDDTETAPFFEEYAQMIGNTALRWVGYMAMVEGNLGTELSPEEQIKLETCNAGFVEIAKKANNALWEGVKASLSPVFARLYGEEWLASGSGEGGAVVATLEDYFADYKDGMHPYLFSTLLDAAAGNLLADYVLCLKKNTFKIKEGDENQFQKLLLRELDAVCGFFRARMKDAEKIMEMRKSVLDLSDALLIPLSETMPATVKRFCRRYPDLQAEVLEGILLKREAYQRGEVKKVLAEMQKEGLPERKTPSMFCGLV